MQHQRVHAHTPEMRPLHCLHPPPTARAQLAESLAVEAGLAPRPLGVAPDGVDAASG